MKTNHSMEVIYDEIRDENPDDPKALPQTLLALLNAGFVEEEGRVFLSPLRKDAPVTRADCPERTQYECFVNHIHVGDYLENGGLPPLELLGRGIALARELKERLSQLHGLRDFRIMVRLQGTICAVRFHTIRPDEEWIDKGGPLEEATATFERQEMEP